MMPPLFFEPLFREKIWGGNRLRRLFGMNIPSDKTGECWLLSALPGEESVVRDGSFAGRTLAELWTGRRELFGNLRCREFPLLVKIIDACDDLSVQVHPDDQSAAVLPGARPKSECWLVLDCPENASIVFGHNAASRAELEHRVNRGEWGDLLRRIPVKKGDFLHVPGGTVHALTRGCMVLEVQQPSDTTYRFYDYGRLDGGRLRPLHLREALAVTTVPSREDRPVPRPDRSGEGIERTALVRSPAFSVFRYRIGPRARFRHDFPFLVLVATAGSGSIDGNPLRAGDCLLLPHNASPAVIEGNLEMVGATQERE